MAGIKLRLKRKELKRPDEFISLTAMAINYILTHRERTISSLVVILLLIGGIWLSLYYIKSRTRRSQESLSQGVVLFRHGISAKDKGENAVDYFNRAISSLKNTIKEHPGSYAGLLARLYIGNSYLNIGEPEKAIEKYEEFISLAKENSLKEVAYWGIARAFQLTKNYEKAVSYYNNLIENGNFYDKMIVYKSLSGALLLMGDKELAIKVAEKGINELGVNSPGSIELKNFIFFVE